MESEPIIWRPNSVSPEEWDSKSRDAQIAWWRGNRVHTESTSKPTMSDVPEYYENGTISLSECFYVICKRATDAEVPGFLDECPDEILTMLHDQLEKYVGDDPKMWPRSFSMGSYAPWATAEEIDASRKNEQQLLWNGIAILKRHLNSGG